MHAASFHDFQLHRLVGGGKTDAVEAGDRSRYDPLVAVRTGHPACRQGLRLGRRRSHVRVQLHGCACFGIGLVVCCHDVAPAWATHGRDLARIVRRVAADGSKRVGQLQRGAPVVDSVRERRLEITRMCAVMPIHAVNKILRRDIG